MKLLQNNILKDHLNLSEDYMFLLIVGIIVLLLVFCYWENNALCITNLKVQSNITKPLRIVHLSDLHGKQFGSENHRLFDRIMMQNPDLILFTGDLIDDDGKNIDECTSFLSKLNKRVPVFFNAGNNEHQSNRYEEIIGKLVKGGVRVLSDHMECIQIQEQVIYILGLDENVEAYSGYKRRSSDCELYKDYSTLFDLLERQKGLQLVMSHYPENYALIGKRSYQNNKFDLLFSGHAHGGQFILPWIGGLFAPGQGIFPKYYSGLYQEPGKPSMCVNRGLGNSAFPLRLFNRPQIMVLDVFPFDRQS